MRVAVAAGLLVWAGAALLLADLSRLGRPTLADRLRPFHPGGTEPGRATRRRAAASSDGIFGPLLRDAGDRLAAALGVDESAATRLARVHSPVSASTFRLRQAAVTAAALVAGALLTVLTGSPPAVSLLLVLGAPALVFLMVEQGLARRSERWREATTQELPIVAEQLAMLLNAGFSVGAALPRLAAHGHGCIARDLSDVVNRVHQGLSERAALEEWAASAGVDGVRRLVSVLALHSGAADLGRLVSAEARAARRDLQRRTVEQIERRAEQVWIPVTVATLVPGAVLLAVPFLAALHAFSNA